MTDPSGDSPLDRWVDPKLLDPDGCIATDFRCSSCEYNLRKLPATSRCPECGRPIEESLRCLDLRWAPLGWVSGLEFGTICILLAHAWLVIGLVIVILFASSKSWGMAIPVLVGMVGIALTLAGTMLLSRPDPRTQGRGHRLPTGQCLRFGPVLAAAAIIVQIWVVIRFVPAPPFFLFLLPIIAAIFFGAVVSLPALYGHMAYLMRAAKDSHLADSAAILARSFLVLGVLALIGVLTATSIPMPIGSFVEPIVCLAVPVGLGYLLCGVAGVSVLYEAVKVLARLAGEISQRRKARCINAQ